MHRKETLDLLLKKAESCNENDPYELADKIIYLSQAQEVIGDLSSDAVRDYNRAYNKRQNEHAKAYLAADKNKAQHAEIEITHLRGIEGDLEAEKVRWQRLYESNQELINALKYKQKTLVEDLKYANFANGGY